LGVLVLLLQNSRTAIFLKVLVKRALVLELGTKPYLYSKGKAINLSSKGGNISTIFPGKQGTPFPKNMRPFPKNSATNFNAGVCKKTFFPWERRF